MEGFRSWILVELRGSVSPFNHDLHRFLDLVASSLSEGVAKRRRLRPSRTRANFSPQRITSVFLKAQCFVQKC